MVPVVAAATRVVRERGERDHEDLVGAARGARTLDEARRALRKWSYLWQPVKMAFQQGARAA